MSKKMINLLQFFVKNIYILKEIVAFLRFLLKMKMAPLSMEKIKTADGLTKLAKHKVL